MARKRGNRVFTKIPFLSSQTARIVYPDLPSYTSAESFGAANSAKHRSEYRTALRVDARAGILCALPQRLQPAYAYFRFAKKIINRCTIPAY